MKKYDYLVFIGRFQPFHIGHKKVVDRALEMSEKVIMLVGGFGKARSPRNPWTFDERSAMIRANYNTNNLIIKPIRDHTYNEAEWLEEVQNTVKGVVLEYKGHFNPNGYADFNIGLIGANKDHTSYYLNLFPQWTSEDVSFLNPINATDIRNAWFEGREWENITDKTKKVITSEYHALEDVNKEYFYYKEYRENFTKNPYPTQHLTADSVVIQSGHVLLIKRRSMPGKGLWALPGGFKNPTETFLQAAMRELKEETKIKVPLPALIGNITGDMEADEPHRSERGTVVSKVYKIELPAGPLPKVKGSDDAEEAKWVPLSELRESEMFEDHYHIINRLI